MRDGLDGAALAFERERVLLLATDAVSLGDVLSRDAHQNVLERIRERTVQRIDESRIAELLTPAHRRRQEGRTTHHLGTAADRGITVAERNSLCCGDDRLQSRAAQTVDGQSRHGVR